jgi:Flp pilus assembly protein TadD
MADRTFALKKEESLHLVADFEASLARALLRLDPQDLNALQILGRAMTLLGRHVEALAVDRRITELAPDDEIAYYNLACSYSNLRKVDEAFEALRRSIDLGYVNVDYMLKDPDLDAVRQDSRFQDLVDSIHAKKSDNPRG